MTSVPIEVILTSPDRVSKGKAPKRFRRVSRDHETDHDVVFSAIPADCMRAAHGDQVKAKLLSLETYSRCSRPKQRRLRRLLDLLIARADYETMTTRPGWKWLQEALNVSRATLARYLADLRYWGLVAIVAHGRQARYATEAGEEKNRINEASVYVLTVPSPLHLVKTRSLGHVDENEIPPAVGGSHLKNLNLTLSHAREKDLDEVEAPPRRPFSGAASGAAAAKVPWRPELQWPAHRTTSLKGQRLAASAQIRNNLPPLRCMSTKDVASVLRDFFLAGWTISDVQNALEFLPTGAKWPHSGAPNTTDARWMRGWLRSRLSGWRIDTGEPMTSPDQRAAAAQTERKAQLRADAERRAQVSAERAAGLYTPRIPLRVRVAKLALQSQESGESNAQE